MNFTVRRTGRLLVSLGVLVTASFFMIHLVPGDPVRASLGSSAPQELVEARRAALGLNDPIWSQYVHYLKNLLAGDFGESITRPGLSVSQIIGQRLPATIELAGLAFVIAMLVSIPLGVLMAALTRGGRRQRTELAFTSSSIVFAAIPEFILAVGLVCLFGQGVGLLGIFPVAGRSGPLSLVLPVISLAVAPTVVLARVVRVEVLTVMEADYIRTARSKRLRAWRLYLRHALPNAVTATLTLSGLLLGGLIAGTVLVESVMAWPGLGSSMVSSILTKDYPLVQGIVLVYGVVVLVINLVVDVVLAVLDPRSAIQES
nr:ABC transporter permease [Streptomyces fuscichromogenes]